MNIPRLIFALWCLLAAGTGPTAAAQPQQHAAEEQQARALAARDPFAPVHVVTSRDLFRKHFAGATSKSERRDSLGNPLVLAELPAHRLADLSRRVHEREKRCGGFFAFATHAEAEAFVREDRSAQAMAKATADLSIDNHATVGPWLGRVREANIRATIEQLSTAWPNRYYASNHGRNAALWIRDAWTGLARGRDDASVELFTACTGCGGQPSVILTVRGTTAPDEIVVVGGHLDSISRSGTGDAMDAPGADDDASGIATITEAARIVLDGHWRPRRTVKFMAYAAEEVGLVGSNAIAQSFRDEGRNVVGVLQLDMTNYAAGSTQAVRVVTDYSNAPLQAFVADLFDAYLAPDGRTRGSYTCGYGCSDHASWTRAGYPAAMLFEPTFFPSLHTPLDTLEQLGGNAATSVPFAKLTLAFVGELAKTAPVPHDFDDDGRSDLLWRHARTGTNTIWRSASATTRQAVFAVTNLDWQVAGVGDFDADGRADVAWRNARTGANAVWKGADATHQQAVAGVTNRAWRIVAVADFDGDGHADLFWRNATTGANALWRSGDAATQLPVYSVTNRAWQVAGAGDFDADGRADLFWRNATTGANAIWRSANAATQLPATDVPSAYWQVAGTGDFDGDGRADLFWRHARTGDHAIWRSADAGTRLDVSSLADLAWRVEGTGDYDGDLRADVLWRHATTGANVMWPAGNAGMAMSIAPVTDRDWHIAP